MGLTRSKVAYNLEESPHKLEVPYGEVSVEYVFSSGLYKRKFYERFIENRDITNGSLSRRFGFKIVNDLICDIRLYSSIEKRGFLVVKGEDKFVCLEDIILDGEKLTKRN